jgi:uncharacterized protein
MVKKMEIKQKILELDDKKKIKFIYLFGSMANGKNTPLSDIDIAIYYQGTAKERFKFRMKVSGNLSDKIDLQIFQDLPLTVKKEVLRGKIIYYDDYQFLFNTVMDVIKEFNQFEKYYNQYFTMLEKRAIT